MTYSTRVVCNAVLARAKDRQVEMTHLKLQKLVYFIHAWGLTLTGKSPINEKPQAWQFGPAFESIYFAASEYGKNPIKKFFKSMHVITDEFSNIVPSADDKSFWQLTDDVMKNYLHFTPLELSALAHEEGSAWDLARAQKSTFISDESIINDFRAKLEAHKKNLNQSSSNNPEMA
jgi:uncharacterized phage-associated protein